MKTVTTDTGIEISIYSSEKELSILRYTEFQKYLILESSIGGSIHSVISRFDRLDAFIKEGKKQDALQENANAKSCLLAILSGVGYYTMAFACLVARVGGEMREDVSADGLGATVELLKSTGLTFCAMEVAIEEVKKKS